MAERAVQILTQQEALERIFETVSSANAGEAPFALVLGAGFSHGLVSTARELITESLPLWMKSQRREEAYEEARRKVGSEELGRIAADYWTVFTRRNEKQGLQLALNSQGLPEDHAAAYQAAFDPRFVGAVGTPSAARTFQRALMRLHVPRLNAAHFLLASVLGVQPMKSRDSPLFKTQAALTRLILTTNFDPFLQTALQSVNRLYFMSDTPDLGLGDEIFDDYADAIHLVYVHGSIHRRSQKATEAEIAEIKAKNARTLAPVLRRHGVIVIGYNGWDDAIVEALATSESFDHQLFWCGMKPDPLASGAFGKRVPEVLRRPSACYVQISSAGQFMAQLCNTLTTGLPRLLANPIGQLREMLEIIDLKELDRLVPVVANLPDAGKLSRAGADAPTFEQSKQSAIRRLKQAEGVFLGEEVQGSADGEGRERAPAAGPAEGATTAQANAERLLSSAGVAERLGNYGEVQRLAGEGLALPDLSASEQASFLLLRARGHYFLGDLESALRDWTDIVRNPRVPTSQLGEALYNRGVVWGQKGETDNALADYTKVIEGLPGAPVEQVASALYNRGAVWGEKGETDNALADYTKVIEGLPGAPVEQVAMALYNRGLVWSEKGETDNALADYTKVIEGLPGAPVEQMAKALNNRALAWGKRGETDKALADQTRIIEDLQFSASTEQGTAALTNRGWTRYLKGDFVGFLADTEAAQNDPTAAAAFNLGLALLANGRDAEAIDAYRRAAERFPKSIEAPGLVDLEDARGKWLSPERARLAIELLRSIHASAPQPPFAR
jgi:tetratricopeptide (TPR) repeat protein